MEGPVTYAAWVDLLEKFGNGDDTVIGPMYAGKFTLDAGTAVRFLVRVEEAYKARKKEWLDKFQRSFQLNNFKSEEDFGIALRNGKQNLLPLIQFVALPGFPEDLRKTLRKDLEDFLAEIKKSIKDNISKIPNGSNKMLMLLNTFGLTDAPVNIPGSSSSSGEIIPPGGRKIIF
jgi:hypothetical protein